MCYVKLSTMNNCNGNRYSCGICDSNWGVILPIQNKNKWVISFTFNILFHIYIYIYDIDIYIYNCAGMNTANLLSVLESRAVL